MRKKNIKSRIKDMSPKDIDRYIESEIDRMAEQELELDRLFKKTIPEEEVASLLGLSVMETIQILDENKIPRIHDPRTGKGMVEKSRVEYLRNKPI